MIIGLSPLLRVSFLIGDCSLPDRATGVFREATKCGFGPTKGSEFLIRDGGQGGERVCLYLSKTFSSGTVISIHSAPAGSSGATISWWRLPPENTLPPLMISSTSGGKYGVGASVMPMMMNRALLTFVFLLTPQRYVFSMKTTAFHPIFCTSNHKPYILPSQDADLMA